MKRYTPFLLALSVAVAAVSVPVALTLVIVQAQSRADAEARMLVLAGEVLRRSNETSHQIQDALHRLQADASREPCSDTALTRMRAIDMASPYLQTVGYVQNNYLVCSSQGNHGTAYPLGKPDYTSNLGYAVRTAVELPPGSGRRLFVSEQNGFAAIVHRDLAIDVFTEEPAVSLGLVRGSSRTLVLGRGEFRVAWLDRLGNQSGVAFSNDDYLVGLKRSEVGDFIVFAAMPTAQLAQRQWDLAIKLVPIGLVVGVAIAVLLLRFVRSQQSMRSQLRAALKRNEFFLLYQPIVAAGTGRIVGAEALIRWRRRDGDQVRPDMFIPAAEESGLITRITAYVMKRVAAELPPVLAVMPDFHVTINIAAADIEHIDLVPNLKQLCAALHCSEQVVVVEMTERGFLNAERARDQIQRIRALNVGVAIDDFGTGYSSLSMLESFTLDYLKIDKSFVDTIGTEAATSQVVLHIIEMAKSLKLDMVAEGVETAEQAAFLQGRGVQFLQGWHFGRPMPISELLERLTQQRTANTEDAAHAIV